MYYIYFHLPSWSLDTLPASSTYPATHNLFAFSSFQVSGRPRVY